MTMERMAAMPHLRATKRHLFYEMLHAARMLKRVGIIAPMRKLYLLGMQRVYMGHAEDFEIADRMRDTWACQASYGQ